VFVRSVPREQQTQHTAATTTAIGMVAFEIPSPLPSRNFQGEYDKVLSNVNAVNHGEFETAVDSLLEQAATVDQGENRAAALAIQRCRRGGKDFYASCCCLHVAE
jgi:hypothetical protein